MLKTFLFVISLWSTCCGQNNGINRLDRWNDRKEIENKQPRAFTVFWRFDNEKLNQFFNKTSNRISFREDRLEELKLPFSTLDELRNNGNSDNSRNNRNLKVAEIDNETFNLITGQTSPRQNITCSRLVNYTCSVTVRVAYLTYCRYLFGRIPCTGHRNEIRESTCQRVVYDCCEGFEVGVSGFCEEMISDENSGCGGTRFLHNTSGIIKSPDYPNNYAEYLNCRWTIVAPRSHVTIIKVMDLAMETPIGLCDLRRGDCFQFCQFDRLQIDGGLSNKTLCGMFLPQNEFLYIGNSVDINFVSDSSISDRGFKLAYTIVEESALTPRQCSNGKIWKICRRICILTCEDTISTEFGEWNICIKYDGTNTVIDSHNRDDITCVPGCECPTDRPVWRDGRCIQIEQCRQSNFRCGFPIPTPAAKIVGGATARNGAWPWMVQMTTNTNLVECGATLICADWVITAAHCFLNKTTWLVPEFIDRDLYWFHLGKYWKFEQDDGRRIHSFRASRVIIHPDYDVRKDLNDIALVQLSGFARDWEFVRPACLPPPLQRNITTELEMNTTRGFPGVGDLCIVTGWGRTRNIGPESYQLKQLQMPVRPEVQCSYQFYIWRRIICAGGNLQEDTCQGDSGGPFMCRERDRWFLRGITSFGEDCGIGKPGGYTRVSHYIPWIRGLIGLHCGR